ncbi:MAG: hypothetical protein JWN65_536 [Solirubrobacterales bacterium]|nr:hypothetical protein [Solirubrobacterales bacterium]
MSLMRQIREGLGGILAILGLGLIAAVVGGYILVQQRLPVPGVERYTVSAEFSSAQAVTPGQGQKVTVSGVGVGEVSNVELVDGRAVVRLTIQKRKLAWVGRDARMLLRPATALQDQSVDLDPGTRGSGLLREQDVLPVSQTTGNVNVDEVLQGLDGDTRQYLQLLVNAGARGTKGRSAQLRAFFKATTPVLAQTRAVTKTLADRRAQLARLIHNLDTLSSSVATKSGELQTLVSAGNATFAALAVEDDALRRSLELLPGTLSAADRALARVRPFAREVTPSLAALTPAVKQLPATLRDAGSFSTAARPVVAQLRGLAREAQPLATDLQPAARQLSAAAPALTKATAVLERLTNELAYEPGGQHHSYLFWAAWFGHNITSMLSTQDANGSWWRGQLIFSCSSVNAQSALGPLLSTLTSTTGVCPKAP